jgi:hypothetical protein
MSDTDYILREGERFVLLPDGTTAVLHPSVVYPIPPGHAVELIPKPGEEGVFLQRITRLQ